MEGLISIVVIASSIWVLIDSHTLRSQSGDMSRVGDLDPWLWFFSCLVLWIGFFPYYLYKRVEFKRERQL